MVTQPVEATLRAACKLEPQGEPVTLPGARHAVRLFTVTD